MMQMAEKYILKLRTNKNVDVSTVFWFFSGSSLAVCNETNESVLIFALHCIYQRATADEWQRFRYFVTASAGEVVSVVGNEDIMFVVLSIERTRVTSQQHLRVCLF